MVEKFHLMWHHIHIPLKEHGDSKDVLIVLYLCKYIIDVIVTIFASIKVLN